MNTPNLLQHPCLTHHQLVSMICNPLKKLGIDFFGFTAADDNNKAYCLGSNPHYAKQYLLHEFVQDDVQHRPENAEHRQCYQFWDFIQLNERANKLYRMAAEFDHSHTLTITRHEKDMTRCYHFSGQLHDDAINQRYLNNLDVLHAFIDYFDKHLIETSELSTLFDYGTQVTNPQRICDKPTAVITNSPATMDLVNQANTEVVFKHLYRYCLTTKERECLYWMKRGKSADMIADMLHVSRKTIERHITNIKLKFDCYTPFQMGVIFAERQLDEFL